MSISMSPTPGGGRGCGNDDGKVEPGLLMSIERRDMRLFTVCVDHCSVASNSPIGQLGPHFEVQALSKPREPERHGHHDLADED